MKKIYAKFTKERNKQFQIETAIYEKADGTRIVEKRPLYKEAETHVEKMYDNFLDFQQQENSFFVSCEKEGNSVFFPFIEGKSFYERIIEAAKEHSREAVLGIFREYKDIIDQVYPVCQEFIICDKFIEVFGEEKELEGKKSVSRIDVDLSFDNLFSTAQGVKILDYEWIMDFLVPVNFPIYRAILALYIKSASLLEPLLSRDEAFRFFEINEKEEDIYLRMNEKFGQYVEGGTESYHQILEKYKQPEDELIKKETANIDWAQVYWGEKNGFSEERSKGYRLETNREVSIEIDVERYPETDYIRIDPVNYPAMIQVVRLEAESEKKVIKLTRDDYQENTLTMQDDRWIFLSEDPQILIPIPQNKGWKKITFTYKVLCMHLESMEELIYGMESFSQKNIRRWQEKFKEQQALAQGQARLLNQCSRQIAEYENTIQMLKDKLAYIESTKAFQTLLKKKVENIHLWDELKQK